MSGRAEQDLREAAQWVTSLNLGVDFEELRKRLEVVQGLRELTGGGRAQAHARMMAAPFSCGDYYCRNVVKQ